MAKQFVRFCADAKRQAMLTETLAYGPTNKKSFDSISPKRAALLPTSPDNVRDMRLPSPQWWENNRQMVTERFNSWIIS